MTRGTYLKFYVRENLHCENTIAYEWILKEAMKMGIHGGSAFRSIAGFGRHHVLHESHFYELAGTLDIEVVFVVTDDEATKLIDLVKREKLNLFYVKIPVEYGMVSGQ
jgi:PII-like signaling protein